MKEFIKDATEKSNLRANIIFFTRDAFQREGIRSVTMDDIAERLSMSKRTLYEMFKDKETLLLACVKEHQRLYHSDVERVANEASNILEVVLYSFQKTLIGIQNTNYKFYQDIKRYPRVVQYLKDCQRKNAKAFVDSCHLGVQQGIFRSDVNYEILEKLVSEQARVLFETDAWRNYTMVDMYRSIMLVSVRGISTEKGQRILDDFIENNLNKI